MLLEKKSENCGSFRVFEFWPILKSKPENVGKCYFTSNFDSNYNLRCKKHQKINWEKKLRLRYVARRNTENFRGFQTLDFVLYAKLKAVKSQKVFFYYELWQ